MTTLIIKSILAATIVLGMMFLTWWSLWKWNDTTSSMLVMGNVVTFREVLAMMAKEIADDQHKTP